MMSVATQLGFDAATIGFILRWFHVLFGITWIGHLYFFNFVNGPFAKTMDADTKKKVVPELMPRALWWFRWGAMGTFLTGVAMLGILSMTDPFYFKDAAGQFQGRAGWVLMGALFGTIMWFNVWFIIWPIQRKLIGWLKAGEKNPDADKLTRKAFLASRANTYLSGPMLFAMLASVNFAGYFGPVAIGLALVLGFGAIHGFIGRSGKVSTAV